MECIKIGKSDPLLEEDDVTRLPLLTSYFIFTSYHTRKHLRLFNLSKFRSSLLLHPKDDETPERSYKPSVPIVFLRRYRKRNISLLTLIVTYSLDDLDPK